MTFDDAIAELGDILRSIGATVTIDPEASIMRPCIGCGSLPPNDLVVVGVQPGNGQPMRRPMCEACQADAIAAVERWRDSIR